jgi:hypothetical protein
VSVFETWRDLGEVIVVSKSGLATETEEFVPSEGVSGVDEPTMPESLVGMQVMVPIVVVRHVPVSPTHHRVRVLVGDSLAEFELDLPIEVVNEWATNATPSGLDIGLVSSGMFGIPMRVG